VQLITSSYAQIQDFFPFMSAGPPSTLDHVWDKNLVTVPLERDQHGRRVFIFRWENRDLFFVCIILIVHLKRLGEWNPNKITTRDFFTAAFTLFELIALEEKTQVAGVTVVADIAGFGFTHLRYIGLQELKCLCNFMTGAFPIWFRKVHIINNPRLFNVFLALTKQFMNDRFRDNVIMHNSDLASLHSEVPPSLLPSYLGGEQPLSLTECVEAAKARNSYFETRIEQASVLYRG